VYMCVIFGENLSADLPELLEVNLTKHHFY